MPHVKTYHETEKKTRKLKTQKEIIPNDRKDGGRSLSAPIEKLRELKEVATLEQEIYRLQLRLDHRKLGIELRRRTQDASKHPGQSDVEEKQKKIRKLRTRKSVKECATLFHINKYRAERG